MKPAGCLINFKEVKKAMYCKFNKVFNDGFTTFIIQNPTHKFLIISWLFQRSLLKFEYQQ